MGPHPDKSQGPQGPSAYVQGGAAILADQAVRVERMLRGVFQNEEAVKAAEETNEPDLVEAAHENRDRHVANLRHAIDYAINTLGYDDSPCLACGAPPMFPRATSEFCLAVGSTDVPTSEPIQSLEPCKVCKGRRLVRTLKDDDSSKAARKRLTYFQKVLDTTILCAKVRARTADSDEAYKTLEQANMAIVTKFSSEKQTSMEAEDAAQGAKMGIFDAAVRFDPTRPENAQFVTVAYNWAYRNSRARRDGEKRAGVYAPSTDAMVNPDDGSKYVDTVAVGESGFGTCGSPGDRTAAMDLHEKVGALPEDERKVVLAMLAGHTVGSAAAVLGMTRPDVRRLRDKAYSGLRETMAGYVEAIRD